MHYTVLNILQIKNCEQDAKLDRDLHDLAKNDMIKREIFNIYNSYAMG